MSDSLLNSSSVTPQHHLLFVFAGTLYTYCFGYLGVVSW